MVKVLVGSENPVKIEATKEAFSKFFKEVEVIGIGVSSKVSNQPVNEETFEGAKNRAFELKRVNEERKLGANFLVGIEGGIIKLYAKWFSFGVVCITNEEGKIGYGTTTMFQIPESIVMKLLNGKELGEVMDEITGENNIKQREGAVGILSKNVISRKDLYYQAIVVALIPFLNEEFKF